MQQTRQFGIGQPVRRVEDRRFITGRGVYVDMPMTRETLWRRIREATMRRAA